MRVDLAEDVHAKLRILAAEAGQAMSAFVRCLAENAVRARFPEVFAAATNPSDPPPARKSRKRKSEG
ncbi:MAG: hypothetical protein ACYC3I_25665 [Gemmataceae bacterium]